MSVLLSAAVLTAGCSAVDDDPVVVTQTVVAGATGPVTASALNAGVGSTTMSSQPTARSRFTSSPKFGSTDLAPVDPVTITAFNATIDEITAVSETDGAVLTGAVSEDGGTWTLTDRMAYATNYRITGTATDRSGNPVPIDGNLGTIDPGETMRACLTLAELTELPLAGIDLRRTADNEWYCFEINPSPGFSYYENATGQPIADAIAGLLVH